MSNFCSNCGAPLNPASTACANCGAPVVPAKKAKKAFDISALIKLTPENKNKVAKIGKLAVPIAALAVILIVVIGAVASGTGAKGAVKDYFKAIQTQDVDDYIDLMPETSKLLYLSEEDLYDDVEQQLHDTVEYLEAEYGKNIKFKVKKIEKEELTNKEKKAIVATYSFSDKLSDIEIKKAYEVDFDITIKGKEDNDTDSGSLVVIKEDSDWKIYSTFDLY